MIKRTKPEPTSPILTQEEVLVLIGEYYEKCNEANPPWKHSTIEVSLIIRDAQSQEDI